VSQPPPSDPDEPTRRLPPARPAEPIREREVVTTVEPEPEWVQHILDRLRSLRTAVALLGLVAVAALGVALWSLLSQEEEGDARRGASQERVRELENRVEELESESGDAPSRAALQRQGDQVDELEQRLADIEAEAGSGASSGAVEGLQEDVTQLSDGVDQLSQAVEDQQQRIDELEQQQSEDTGSP
jgi:DNA repair exonuclease SbcCD ATPase subunit